VGFSLRFEAMSMLSNRPELTLVRIEDLNPRGLAGFPYRHLSCFLALLWPKCDRLADGLLAAANYCAADLRASGSKNVNFSLRKTISLDNSGIGRGR